MKTNWVAMVLATAGFCAFMGWVCFGPKPSTAIVDAVVVATAKVPDDKLAELGKLQADILAKEDLERLRKNLLQPPAPLSKTSISAPGFLGAADGEEVVTAATLARDEKLGKLPSKHPNPTPIVEAPPAPDRATKEKPHSRVSPGSPGHKFPKFEGNQIIAFDAEGFTVSAGAYTKWIPLKDLTEQEFESLVGFGMEAEGAARVAELEARISSLEKKEAEVELRRLELEKAALAAAEEAELNRMAEASVARFYERQAAERAEQVQRERDQQVRELEMLRISAEADQAEELRLLRIQLELEAARARGQNLRIYDYGPRQRR